MKVKSGFNRFNFGEIIIPFLFKIFLGLGLTAIYLFHYKDGDTLNYQTEAVRLLPCMQEHPFRFFLGENGSLLINSPFADSPSAYFFTKIVTLVSALSGGNYWISSVIFTILSFAGSWYLFKTIARYYARYKRTAFIALFFLPTYVFWTSGILKESIVNLCVCIIITCLLDLLHSKQSKWGFIILIILCGSLLYKLKFYFFGVLFPVVIAYYLYSIFHVGEKAVIKRIAIGLLLLILASLVFMASHEYLNPWVWKDIILESSQNLLDKNSIPFSMVNLIKLIPASAANTWFAPQMWQATNGWQFLAAVENSGFLILLILSLGFNHKFLYWKLETWLILIITIVSGSFIGLAISNTGSLVRLKSVFYPLVFMLCAPAVDRIMFFIKSIFAGKKKNHGETGNNFRGKRNWQSGSTNLHQ